MTEISPFSSLVWSKEEIYDKTEELKKRQFLFGISYNIDKALGGVR